MSTLSDAMQALWPTLNFADIDGTLPNVRYDEPLPDNFVAPTQDQIDYQIALITCYANRKAEYPPLANLADALTHQSMGDDGVALNAYYTACEAVKTKYPKPAAPNSTPSPG